MIYTVHTAYKAVVGTLWKSRYNPDRSVRGPGGGGGHHAAAVGVSGVDMVLILIRLTRGTQRWVWILGTTYAAMVLLSAFLLGMRNSERGWAVQEKAEAWLTAENG